MPKIKTKKSLLKRIKITKKGKILRRGSYCRHLKANKTKKRSRRQKVPQLIKGRIAKKIKKVLGK